MTDSPNKNAPRGGGALIALSILGGAVAGIALGQPSLGVVAGIVVGSAIATLIWWRDRR